MPGEKKGNGDLHEYEKEIRSKHKIYATSVNCCIRTVRLILTNEDGWKIHYDFITTKN